MQSSHSLLTFPLRPLPMQLQAIHYSSLVISCLSLHPQQQIFPRTSSYQLLNPSQFPVRQEYKPVSYFVYKSVLQVTSSNLRIQHTYLLLQAIVLFLLLRPPCFVTFQSGRFGRYSGDASFVSDPFITPTPKAKPHSSAQLLLCAVGRNRAK